MLEKIDDFGNGLKVFTPKIFKDDRGYFFESFNENEWDINTNFIQDNESCSSKGVMRGLHYQAGEFAQAKLVRVVKGAVVDFVLDIRQSSPTFKKMFFVLLSEENKKQFYVPRGFAHGFISLTDNTIFSYKCDNYYNKLSERGININDPSLNIFKTLENDFNISFDEIILSDKDKLHPNLENAANLFE